VRKDLQINGADLRVEYLVRTENRPTIIFLHGSLGSIELWRDFPYMLGEMTDCNVLVYDRQGYGKSSPFTTIVRNNNYLEKEADVLRELWVKLQLENVILFGHSDGGSIALIAAAKYPAVVMGVITEGAHIFVEELTLNGIREAAKLYETTNLKERLEKYHGDKTSDVFHAWTKTWLRDEYRSWNIEHFLPKIACPVLVIQGANDEYGSEAQVDGIVQQVSGKAVKLMIPLVGHTPHKEEKAIVLEESASFIKKLLSDPSDRIATP